MIKFVNFILLMFLVTPAMGFFTTTISPEIIQHSLTIQGDFVITGIATVQSALIVESSVTANTYYGDGSHLTGVTLSSSTVVKREIPTGDINGVNDTFYIAHDPVTGTEDVYLNGLMMNSGEDYDYTITLGTITFNAGAIPETDWSLRISYTY